MRKTNRRGNVVTVGLLLSTLIGFGALSVDVGMIRLASAELQQTVDAAAFSGTQEFDGTTAGITRAVATAAAIAAANPVLGASVSLDTAEIIPGSYDKATKTFVPYADGDDPTEINALRITRDAAEIGSGLGAIAFGIDAYTVKAKAASKREPGTHPAGSSLCFLPIAIPSCHLAGLAAGHNPSPYTMTFSSSTNDDVSWGMLKENPNSNDVRDQLETQCDHGALVVGESVYVNEGNHTTALQTIADILNDKGSVDPTVWDTDAYGPMPSSSNGNGNCGPGGGSGGGSGGSSDVTSSHWGNTLEGPIPIVDAGTDCNAVSFTGQKEIVGIAWGVLYDVATTGSNKYVKIQLDVVSPHEIWGDKATTSVVSNVEVPSDPEYATW